MLTGKKKKKKKVKSIILYKIKLIQCTNQFRHHFCYYFLFTIKYGACFIFKSMNKLQNKGTVK